jgi:A/G-specific adenine glycosylase
VERNALLAWYEPRRRAYPWRRTSDPYRIWVSEVMLQQTQVARVIPAYRRFVRRFPTVRALGEAPLSDVISAWDGLGYNRRAVALSGAAKAVVETHDGLLPSDQAALRALPGVGPCTAAAVASIAFDLPVAAVDTNVRRIVARARFGTEPHGVPSAALAREAERWVPVTDPGAWNQALMDLGREVCRPRPRCGECPLARTCRSVGRDPAPRSARAKDPGPVSGRRQAPFEGSSRQVRGAVVRTLRGRRRCTVGDLVRGTGLPLERVVAAVVALRSDGLVSAGPAALRGSPGGVVRLPT